MSPVDSTIEEHAAASATIAPETDVPPVPTHPSVDVERESADGGSSEGAGESDYHSLASSTTSVTSTIFNYQYENGRRYHAYKAGQYMLPNDDTEQDRLDMTHHIFRLALGGDLCVAKLDKPQRILDVGTGTGIWAIEMGDLYPAAEIIGTDLSPVQPELVPPNVVFEIDDAVDQWTYPPDHFDFVHVRALSSGIQDWPALLRQCFQHLKPGGQLEVSEGRANLWYAHGSVPEDSYTYQWLMEWRRLQTKVQFDIFPALKELTEALPFENVRTVEKLVPMGPWPKDPALKELGRYFRVQFLEMALEAFTLALFTRLGGWQELEIKVLLAKVRKEMIEGKMHLYTFCSFVTARKPSTSTSDSP